MKKILEIGGGRTPYFVRYNIDWDTENTYTSVDISPQNVEYAKESFEKYKKEGKAYPYDIEMIVGDATKTDFNDESFDEIIISNTLSAPIHRGWDRDGNILKIKTKSGVVERPIVKESEYDDPFYTERNNMIKEAERALKLGGVLTIYTDLIIYGVDFYQRILQELQNNSIYEYQKDEDEEKRIDELNKNKLNSKEFCCCFRAEVLPKSEVYRFKKLE